MLNEILDKGYLRIEGALSIEKVEAAHVAMDKLFSMPLDEKLKYKHDRPTDPGFTPYGLSKALDTGVPNLLEAWDTTNDRPYKWPAELIDGWHAITELQEELAVVTIEVLGQLEKDLLIPKSSLSSLLTYDVMSITLLHYPDNLAASGTQARRQSVHTDMSLLTINPKASAKGLIVEHNGKKVIADPDGGDVAVLPGRVMEYVTGGKIKGCLHTVETPETVEKSTKRISMPFFAVPKSDTILNVFLEEAKGENSIKMSELNDDYFGKIFGSQSFSGKKPTV